MSQDPVSVKIQLQQTENYRFELSFDRPESLKITVDEGAPLGQDAGPNPARMLAAAVGHCLTSSFIFCLEKSRHPIKNGISTKVEAKIVRNADKRLRIGGISVDISLPDAAKEFEHELSRCEKLFESYCTVTASIRGSIPVLVRINGKELPSPN